MSVLARALHLQPVPSREVAAAEPLLAALKGTPVSHTSKDNENGCDIRFVDRDGLEICTLFIGKNNDMSVSINGFVCDCGSALSSNDVSLALDAFLSPHAGKSVFSEANKITKNLTALPKRKTTLDERVKERIADIEARRHAPK